MEHLIIWHLKVSGTLCRPTSGLNSGSCFWHSSNATCDIPLLSTSLFSPVQSLTIIEIDFPKTAALTTLSNGWTEIIRGLKRWWEFCWMFSRQWLKKVHICHRTVVHRWLKTNWAQESSSRFEMESRNKSVTDNDFDWSGFVPGNVSFEDPKGVQTAVTLSTYIGLGAPIGNWDITGNSFRHVIKQAITRQGCSLMKSFVICKGFV